MEDLSPRQRDVLDYIQSTIAQQGLPPTYREIGDALGISSTNGVADHVKALIRKGYIKKADRSASGGIARGLLLTSKSQSRRRGAVVSVPLVGTVAAGQPMLAEQNYERTLHLDRSMASMHTTTYALRVHGESMIEEGILDGDLVIVRQQSTAQNGDIVVVMVDGEATVKFFFREKTRIRLQPAHPTMAPIYLEPSHKQAAIQGVVIGVYRKYH